MRNSIHSFLDDCLVRGDETAFAERRGFRVVRHTYSEIAHMAYRFARELKARNINKSDRILFWAENSTEWVAAFFGCALRGVVAVPLDEQSAPDFVLRVQQQVKAKLSLCGQEQHKHFPTAIPTLRFDQLNETIARHDSNPCKPENIGGDDLLEIIFTSGTTAEPKGVCLTHRNLLANLNPLEAEIQKYLWLERSVHPLRFLCLLPLSHVFGQFMGMFVPLLLGGEAFFQHSQKPSEIIATIKHERISVAAAVPRQLETLREQIERDFTAKGKLEDFHRRFDAADGKHFLRRWWVFRDLHWRFGWKFLAFVSGGATLDQETENFWQRLSFAVVQGYGMTETASLVSINHPFKASRGSIGKTLPGQEVKLGEGGEILVRGDNVSTGYWRDGSQEIPNSGAGETWLHTGDLAAVDDAGNLFFKGRRKDVIVTAAGVNIYPDDLEQALNRQPEVRNACVLGIEGAQGPEPMAALILRDENTDAAEIVNRANCILNPSQQIRRWFLWPEADFPRTATQKIRKPLVKEFVLAHTAEQSSRPMDQVSPLAGILAKLGGKDLSQLDSLGRVALLSAIEDRYQIELDEAALTPETKLSDLEQLVTAGNQFRGNQTHSGVEYPYPRWSLSWPVNWLRAVTYSLLIVPFVCAMCWPRVQRKERLANLRGPVLFIANHISMVDPAMILFALPWRFKRKLAIAMAGERLRALQQRREGSNWFSRLFDPIKYLLVVIVFNVFSLPQKSGFRRSFLHAGEAADSGFNVLVFPEGRTTETGQMNPFMSGIGLLAQNLNLPVVPIKIAGLFDLTKQRRYFSRPGTVTISFGNSIQFPIGAEAAQITQELEAVVSQL